MEKVSLKNGYWFYFDDDGSQIVAFVSALAGKEVVFANDEIVSSTRSFKFNASHFFEHRNHKYELIISTENIFTGAISCSLLKEGSQVSKTRKSFHQKSLKKLFIATFVVGVIAASAWPGSYTDEY